MRLLVVLLALVAARGTPRTHTIEIHGMAFHPETVVVARGDTVVWINRDIVPHTATAVADPRWNTGQLARDAEGRYVPRRAGVLDYICTLHPTMRATLIVKEPS